MLRVLTPLVYLLLYVLSAPAFAERQPNILLLLADDFGYSDSAIYSDLFQQNAVTSMPTLESFAKQGVRFTRFYTESSCSSSRAALLTGQYAARNGFMPVARGISADVVTLPESLQARGYNTHLVGKWHAGEINAAAFPENQGFDTTFAFLGQWFLKGPDAQGLPQLKVPTYTYPWLRKTGVKNKTSYQQYQGHLEDILVEHTVNLIRNENKTHPENKESPWFIYHAFFAPHTPLVPAERFASQYANTPEGKYRAMLAQMDDNLLKIFSALKESGQWDNTIIIFASDNGSPDKVANSNAPFKGGKTEYDEGGIRTPLLIKWQHQPNSSEHLSPEQVTRSDVVSIMDIYPSLLLAIGARATDVKNMDGIPSLLLSNPQLRSTTLHFLSYNSLSVLSADGQYRLLREWGVEKFTRTQLFKYDERGLPVDVEGSWLEKIFNISDKVEVELFNDFLRWRNRLRTVPVYTKNGAVKGRDFLRTPINPAFAVSVSFSAKDIRTKQSLLSQKGSLDVYIENGAVFATVRGLSVKAEGLQPDVCYQLVLSGEFHDKFSSVQGNTQMSYLHLILNGKQVDTASGTIDSLADVDLRAPTMVGKIAGVISEPVFFSTQLLPDDKPIPSGFDETTARLSVCRAE